MLTTIICLYGLCFNPIHIVTLVPDNRGIGCWLIMRESNHTYEPKFKDIPCEQLAAEINKELRK